MSSEAISYFPDGLGTCSETEVKDSGLSQVSALQPNAQAVVSPRTDALSDETLLQEISTGSREALSTIFQRYARAVRNVGYKILRDQQEAEDLVQEVFLFIFRKASLFNPELGKAGSWIIHVAYHRAFDRRRYLVSRHFYEACDLDSSATKTVAMPERIPTCSGGMQEILGKSLMIRYEQRLSEGQRRVIELFFFGGNSFEEVAEILGLSVSNVRKQYYRGLERLRRYVLPKDFPPQ
jgi:RNA polymerase sigma-70 factor (ECF subfamily)